VVKSVTVHGKCSTISDGDLQVFPIINVKDGTRLVQVIVWHKQNECLAVQALIHQCKGNGYICVISRDRKELV
jgi:hypothetical protein